jgi:hypothetical protein
MHARVREFSDCVRVESRAQQESPDSVELNVN